MGFADSAPSPHLTIVSQVGFTRTGKNFEWWANVYNNAAAAAKVLRQLLIVLTLQIEKPKTVYNDAFHTGGVQHTLCGYLVYRARISHTAQGRAGGDAAGA